MRYGGDVNETVGDGLMVTFPSALQAVGCAVAMQRAIAGHNLADPDRALQIRIGLHLGEPAADEDDFYGTSVVVAKRLIAEGEPLGLDNVRFAWPPLGISVEHWNVVATRRAARTIQRDEVIDWPDVCLGR